VGRVAARARPLARPPRREYVKRYRAEMREREERVEALARRVAAGERIALLCSSACTDPERCHRTLLARLVEGENV